MEGTLAVVGSLVAVLGFVYKVYRDNKQDREKANMIIHGISKERNPVVLNNLYAELQGLKDEVKTMNSQVAGLAPGTRKGVARKQISRVLRGRNPGGAYYVFDAKFDVCYPLVTVGRSTRNRPSRYKVQSKHRYGKLQDAREFVRAFQHKNKTIRRSGATRRGRCIQPLSVSPRLLPADLPAYLGALRRSTRSAK